MKTKTRPEFHPTYEESLILMWLAEHPVLRPTLTGIHQEVYRTDPVKLMATMSRLTEAGLTRCQDGRYSITKDGMAILLATKK